MAGIAKPLQRFVSSTIFPLFQINERLFDAIIVHFSDLLCCRERCSLFFSSCSATAIAAHTHRQGRPPHQQLSTERGGGGRGRGGLLVLCVHADCACIDVCACVRVHAPFMQSCAAAAVVGECRAVVETTHWKAAFISKATYNNFIWYNKHRSDKNEDIVELWISEDLKVKC